MAKMPRKMSRIPQISKEGYPGIHKAQKQGNMSSGRELRVVWEWWVESI